MNKFVFASMFFTIGAAVGGFTGYIYTKQKLEMECQEEIDKVIESYKKPDADVNDISDEDTPTSTNVSDGVVEFRKEKRASNKDYTKSYSGEKIEVSKGNSESKTTPEIMHDIEKSDEQEVIKRKPYKNSDAFAEFNNDWSAIPIIIPEQEFDKPNEDFDKVCLFVDTDNTVLDTDGELYGDKDDVAENIGWHNINHIKECDVVFVRNDKLNQLYEIREL